MQHQEADMEVCMEGLRRRLSIVSMSCMMNSGNIHGIPSVSPAAFRASVFLRRRTNHVSTGPTKLDIDEW